MSDRAMTPVACASYTYARRHPKVLGRIGGWAPPVQLSFVQLGTLATSLALLALSWDLWAPFLPPSVRLLVITGVPSALCWAVRRSRVEGRSLVRAALGAVALACQPGAGTVHGHAAPSPKTADWTAQPVWFEASQVRR